jgi:hypothetical protein
MTGDIHPSRHAPLWHFLFSHACVKMLQGISSLDPVLCVVTPCSLVDGADVLEEPVVAAFGLEEQP